MSEPGFYVRTSILDRLIDLEPSVSSEPVQNRMQGIEPIKKSVVHHLELLLNTRRLIEEPAAELRELNKSLLLYGLKDFTAENPNSIIIRQQLRQDIEKTLVKFEPRLKNVRVHLETGEQNLRKLRFRITAVLHVEPLSEPVAFDTFFDMNRGLCTVTG
ncbi:type VI secretion system baseplate subunit TssE [Malonomonas rubra]|uniref:type VI secretion system baseplate subunit TssE n=1 Tax=Malonomonas rubra TaxID=57040 RepID=UPI0026F04017|nr:type VI secretion system baseplate subunit TssE [Malonomonas rubra]